MSNYQKRTRIVEDIRDLTLDELIEYYAFVGGRCPILGTVIPLRWLVLDRYALNSNVYRNTDLDGRYNVPGSYFTFKWLNDAMGLVLIVISNNF
jgi:hypothetical protein